MVSYKAAHEALKMVSIQNIVILTLLLALSKYVEITRTWFSEHDFVRQFPISTVIQTIHGVISHNDIQIHGMINILKWYSKYNSL